FSEGDRADGDSGRRLCRFSDHLCDAGPARLADVISARPRYTGLRGQHAPALWITALNVKYRDFRYVIPFIVQFGLYVSPVGFTSIVVPEEWRLLYSVNPMVGVIDGFGPRRPRGPLRGDLVVA